MPTPSELGQGYRSWEHLVAEGTAFLAQANTLLRNDSRYQETASILLDKRFLVALGGVWDTWDLKENVRVLGLFERERPKPFRPDVRLPEVTADEMRWFMIEDKHKERAWRQVWGYIWDAEHIVSSSSYRRENPEIINLPAYTDSELHEIVEKALEKGGRISISGRPVYGHDQVENLRYRMGGGLPTRMDLRHIEGRKIGNVSAGIGVTYRDGAILIDFMGRAFNTVGEVVDYISDKVKKGKVADLYSAPVDMRFMAQLDKRDREEERKRGEREKRQNYHNDYDPGDA